MLADIRQNRTDSALLAYEPIDQETGLADKAFLSSALADDAYLASDNGALLPPGVRSKASEDNEAASGDNLRLSAFLAV